MYDAARGGMARRHGIRLTRDPVPVSTGMGVSECAISGPYSSRGCGVAVRPRRKRSLWGARVPPSSEQREIHQDLPPFVVGRRCNGGEGSVRGPDWPVSVWCVLPADTVNASNGNVTALRGRREPHRWAGTFFLPAGITWLPHVHSKPAGRLTTCALLGSSISAVRSGSWGTCMSAASPCTLRHGFKSCIACSRPLILTSRSIQIYWPQEKMRHL